VYRRGTVPATEVSMKTRKTSKARKQIQTATWQWDPATLTLAQIQLWSASGTFRGLVALNKARELVKDGYAFCGGPNCIRGWT
jgi:hypothetical protein